MFNVDLVLANGSVARLGPVTLDSAVFLADSVERPDYDQEAQQVADDLGLELEQMFASLPGAVVAAYVTEAGD